MDTVNANLASVTEKLDRIGTNVEANMESVQNQLKEQERVNRQLRADIVETKERLNGITEQLEQMTHETSQEEQAEEMKKGIAEPDGVDRETKVVIAGGANPTNLKSVEIFSQSNGIWTPLQPMEDIHSGASSVVYNNQLFVVGGWTQSIEKLSLGAVHVDQSIPWENVPAELPVMLEGHCSVVYNGRLIVIGGLRALSNDFKCLDSILEISLEVPPSTTELTTMKQARRFHGVATFGDKIVIFGGAESLALKRSELALDCVVMYDISKNEFNELAPLPHPVSAMAIVKWGDENVIIMGGADSNDQPLNKVIIYNIKTQKSYELPDMKYKRKGCVAAVVKDTVIVMGGQNERGNYLKSVESFKFDRFTWEDLPEMNEARSHATAVA
ncbi:kelch 3, partial [Paramuricea clavata]